MREIIIIISRWTRIMEWLGNEAKIWGRFLSFALRNIVEDRLMRFGGVLR